MCVSGCVSAWVAFVQACSSPNMCGSKLLVQRYFGAQGYDPMHWNIVPIFVSEEGLVADTAEEARQVRDASC